MSTIVVNSIALERSILKEIMQSGNAAMDVVASILGANSDHFYDELRRNIYAAIVLLYEENRNINSIIVFEKLKAIGKFNSMYREEFTRINSVKITNEITEACLMLLDYSSKRKIGQIFEGVVQKSTMENITCQDLMDDIVKGMDDIVSKNAISETTSLPDIVSKTLSKIYDTADAELNGREIGTFPGFVGLKTSIGNFTGNQLVVIAGRPAQGKTAFALSMAIEMSKRFPVAFFSLEMDNEQLMLRVLSRELIIPLQNLRSGRLTDDDNNKLLMRSSDICSYNLIIDDRSELDMMLLRNKIRKYVNESGIKAVIIDYLQLMTPPNARSREQEVSIMTRTLKKLSKIYDIPIIILAQLNRGVEQRGADAVPQLSDLRECLSVDTSKIYSKYGLSTVDSDSVNVLSVTKNNTVDSNVGIHIPKEPNDVYRITTKSGRYVDCTLNHKLITTSGKKYVKDLSVLDSLCVPTHFLNEDGRGYVEESRFIGWMIGNGSMVGSHSPSFITSCGVVSEDFCEYIETKFGKRPKNHPHHSSDKVFQWDITFSDVRTKEGNPCTKWLRDNDLWGNQSYDKKIPDWYMSSADRQSICELMQGLIETDGCVIANSNRSKIRYSTTSKTLADQIIYLLASIGIVATINTYVKKEYRTIYNIDIDDTEMLNRFVRLINIRGYRGEKVKELKLNSRHNYLNNKLNRDTTLEIQSKLSSVKSKYRIQTHGNRRLTVKNAKEIILEHVDIMQEYLWMVADHYYWDAIKSIELIGQKEVFDLSVPCDNNFIVNGILSSNSGAIEQDADIVMFIHQGSIHVAKQRQGAVGIVPLDYNKTFTSFWDTSPAGITM